VWDFGGLAGPYYQWTRKVNGKTMTRLLSAAQLVEHLFDPPGRWGTPSRFDRREMADAILFLARTGCQWRYLPDRYPPWPAVWQQWRR